MDVNYFAACVVPQTNVGNTWNLSSDVYFSSKKKEHGVTAELSELNSSGEAVMNIPPEIL